ncbi:MAG: glycoside hydrolase family 13 protein [Balneola sp.]|nr:MAG: glycoside hydrolase family 13 protein [Balneola sp.]
MIRNLSLLLLLVLVIGSCVPEKTKEFHAPEWAEGVVWYQIFPERFRDGDPTNQPNRERARGPEGWEITSWTQDWYKRDAWEVNHSDDFYSIVRERRYGGDLQGVIDKLDYLHELGVGVIYFNPVFDAQSMHKYDASYYHHIDRNFGPDPEGDVQQILSEDPGNPETWGWTEGDKLFLQLINEAHKRGMKIVIDGVFNHTGTEFWAFQDLIKNQENSPYKDWYIVTSYDDPNTPENEFDYEGWWGFKGLPVYREENENLTDPVKQHIFEVTKRWMDPNGDGDPSDGVDGWRLDVASEVGKNFWRDWHAYVRSINSEAITVAEIWTDEAKEFITADMFTSVMNYRFTDAVKLFMIDQAISEEAFRDRLVQIESDYPEASLDVLQNLMDSHDTSRLATSVVNKGQAYNPDAYPNEDYEVRKPNSRERSIQKLAALFQYTWKGAPMIYYGTESGMWGADDPDDRKPMVWPDLVYEDETYHPYGWERPVDSNNFDEALFGYYKKLGEIRNISEALKRGSARFTVLEKEFISFERVLDSEPTVIVSINWSDSVKSISLPACPATDLLSGDEIQQEQISVSSLSAMIIQLNCRG